MVTQIESVTVDTDLLSAVNLMRDSKLSCLLVMDNDKPVGIVTERDIVRLAADLLTGKPCDTLANVMTGSLITLPVSTTIDQARAVMAERKIRKLLLVDETGHCCGLVTPSIIAQAQYTTIEHQKNTLENRVKERTLRLEQVNAQLLDLTLNDPLTGVGNRRALDKTLQEFVERTRRYKRPYSLAMIDVDYFKPYNDHYGHQLGDRTLQMIAAIIEKTIRRLDAVFRYGGEEFLVLLPETHLHGASIAAEHIRTAIASGAITHIKSPTGYVTCSFGVAEENMLKPDSDNTIARADEALYLAKSKGRNKVNKAA